MTPSVPMITVGQLVERKEANIQTGPFGTQLHASEYVESGTPVINVRNVGFGNVRDANLEFISDAKAEKLHVHRLEKGDIVFGRKGAVERHALISDEQAGWVQGSDCLRLRLSSAIVCERYFSYYLRTQAHHDWMQALCSFGATMPSLNQGIVKRISFPLRSLPVQRRIAAILTAYDDLIETNKRRIALLEKMAEELYREWFVRMRFPGYQSTKFVKGVPESWPQKRFGEFCMLKRGYDLPDALVEPGQYPVIASTSIKTFHKHFKAEPPVITTGRSGSLGQVLMTHSRAWPLNTTLYVLNFLGNSAYFTFYMLKNMGLESFNSGAGVPTLNRNHLNGLAVFVPEPNLQKGFDGIVEPLHQQADKLRQANVNLTQTRDLLLPRLISGKLSVKDLDIQLPPSMREEVG